MIATVSDFTLNLSQIISIELKTTCYDDEMDKVIFLVRPVPQYVYNPETGIYTLVNAPVEIVRKYSNTAEASCIYESWLGLWKEYVEKLNKAKEK